MRINLTDRVAVVTGATGELGRVMARTLAACGASAYIPVCGGNVMPGI